LTIWFLAFLALIWIGVFLPGAVRAKRRTPLPAATRFKRVMTSIAPSRPSPRHAVPRPSAAKSRTDSGRWVIVPYSDERARQRAAMKQAQQRRRRMLALLLAAAVTSAVAAVLRGQPWLEIHLMLDGALLFYVALLHETKRRRDERFAKVRSIERPVSDDAQVLSPVSVGGEHS